MITIAHKIELKPNDKQKTYFHKAFGCARLAYNWGLAEWQRQYKNGIKPTGRHLRDQFNAIRSEQYPFTYEVTKYATAHSFDDLQDAFNRFFSHQCHFPVLKRKKDNKGSFYVGNDQLKLSYKNGNSKSFKTLFHNEKQKHQYLHIPNLGWVRMTECLRFKGKINGVKISQNADKYFASFSLEISEEEYKKSHRNVTYEKKGYVGIDLGVKYALILSDNIYITNPKPLINNQRKLKRLQRQLSRCIHARNKQEHMEQVVSSSNYRKKALLVKKLNLKIANRRHDFQNKVTTILTTFYQNIEMEDLCTEGMKKNHRLARSVADVSFGRICRMLTYKANYNGVTLKKADRFYPSSKTCSCCGNVVKRLTSRTYRCKCCGMIMDRDLNAAINLGRLIKNQQIGQGLPEFTPVDLTALHLALTKNQIATSKVESGRQHKLTQIV